MRGLQQVVHVADGIFAREGVHVDEVVDAGHFLGIVHLESVAIGIDGFLAVMLLIPLGTGAQRVGFRHGDDMSHFFQLASLCLVGRVILVNGREAIVAEPYAALAGSDTIALMVWRRSNSLLSYSY